MRVLIVGGVAGGMSAAARLRRLDETAEIIVFERNRYVSFANCGLPYHIGGDIENRDSLLVVTPDQLRANLNIDVRTGHMVTEINRSEKSVKVIDLHIGRPYNETYDKLVLAQGGTAVRLPLPGVDHPRIFTLQSLTDMDAIKAAVDGGAKHAVVIGGGYIGVEMVEALCHRELEVHLVELQDQVMLPLDPEMATDLRYHMEHHGVTFHLGVSAQKFEDASGRIVVTLSNGTTINTDLVLMAAGVRPMSGLAQHADLEVGALGGVVVNQHQQTSDPDIYAVGDMVEVTNTITDEAAIIALAGPANRQGRIAADHIKGRNRAYQSTQGTAIVKVFEMTGGGTGISEKLLRQRKQPYRKVYLHPSGHAGYYPGTASMHLKLLFTPTEGKILGAQIVGFDGVDKRLDVFATAIRAGLTVYDLEHLELAYAPPYGSAKDPVNMAGFLATNLLQGDVQFWYPEDHPDKTKSGTVLDVRTQTEHDTWHIPGSVHIPLRELRGRLDELKALPGPFFIYCLSGFRSYLAYRIVYQAGHADSSTLAGGVKTFNSFHRTKLATGKRTQPFVSHAEDELVKGDTS